MKKRHGYKSDLTCSAWIVRIVMEQVPWGWLFGVHKFEVQRGFGGAELALHLKFFLIVGGTFIVST
jgi:hypothetical protein